MYRVNYTLNDFKKFKNFDSSEKEFNFKYRFFLLFKNENNSGFEEIFHFLNSIGLTSFEKLFSDHVYKCKGLSYTSMCIYEFAVMKGLVKFDDEFAEFYVEFKKITFEINRNEKDEGFLEDNNIFLEDNNEFLEDVSNNTLKISMKISMNNSMKTTLKMVMKTTLNMIISILKISRDI